MKHSIILKNFKFSREFIKINEGDEIEVIIGKNEYNYKKLTNQNTYIIFQIMNENEDEEELDTSSKLYEKQKYDFKFNFEGNFFITALNIPNLYLKVQVCLQNKNKIINTKNLNSLKTNENTHLDYNFSEKNSIISKELKEFTFASSTTNKENNKIKNKNEKYFEDKVIKKEEFDNELPLLNEKETPLSTFSKIVQTFKINKKNKNSLYKIYDNIKSYEFKNLNKNEFENFDEFTSNYFKKINPDKININIDEKFLFNKTDDYYLNLFLN